ncbi:MAG: hypothetical protein LBJ24_08425 [Treponema sp.]|jgi:hypothetical protein|nr:hypothetical protein [Treponema sp.]
MKGFLLLPALAFFSVVCFAEDASGEKDFFTAPVLLYDYVSLDGQQFHAPGEGLIFTKGKLPPAFGEKRNSLSVMAMARQYFFMQKNAPGYADRYHDIGLAAEWQFGRHQIRGFLQSASNEPFYGGLRTVKAGAGYGYDVLHTERFSLTLGGILAVSDFGLEYADGKIWPVIPLPLVRFTFNAPLVDLEAELMAITPSLKCTLLPDRRFRLITEARMNGYRHVRNIIFDCSLWYRFFDQNSKRGDFAGIGIGANSNSASFNLDGKDKDYELQYFSVYGKLDVSFLSICGGYAFGGRELYDEEAAGGTGDGFFVSVRLAYRF